jgi:hypothetical protein
VWSSHRAFFQRATDVRQRMRNVAKDERPGRRGDAAAGATGDFGVGGALDMLETADGCVSLALRYGENTQKYDFGGSCRLEEDSRHKNCASEAPVMIAAKPKRTWLT